MLHRLRAPHRLALGLSLLLITLLMAWQATPPAPAPAPAIRSITLDARRAPSPDILPRLKSLGITHLTLISFAYQPRLSEPTLRHNPNARWYSESDAGIRELAQQARALGMDVILKPHIWVGGGGWRGELAYADEADWATWESGYHPFIMHYAHLAQEIDADILVIGTELARSVLDRPAFWKGLIADVRAVYDGKVSYAANWYAEYEDVTFWADLDYVGVQAYFPLTEAPNPTLDMLKEGWAPYHKSLARIHKETGRPILFTEIGYRSIAYAAAEPWRWFDRSELGTEPPDYDLQALLYQAFFEAMWHEPWMAGVIVWKWDGSPRISQRPPLDFTPQDKPAEQVLGHWFTSAQ